MSDPRVAAIPVRECGEGLVDIRAHGLKADARRRDAAGAFAHVRHEVLTRLLRAQSLLPVGVLLLFVEGYRPPVLQRRYFDRYSDELATAHPEWPPPVSARPRTVSSRPGDRAALGRRGRGRDADRRRGSRVGHGDPRQRQPGGIQERLLHRRPGLSARPARTGPPS